MPVAKPEPSKGLVIAAFAALYIIWGSTYLGILYAIESIPPFLLVGARFLIAGALLYAWCLYKREKPLSLKAVGITSLAGMLMLFVGNGAVVWVEQYLPSGLAAIIVATVPLWFVALDRREWKNYFSNKWIIIGLLVGFAGVMLLFSGKSAGSILGDRTKVISFFILIAGTIGWTAGSLISKYRQTEGSTAMKVAVQMLAAGAAAMIVGLIIGEHRTFSFSNLTGNSVAALAYLIVFGSLVGYMSYIWLLGVRPPSLVGTYAYVNPVVAVFLGWLIAGEPLGQIQVIALSVILLGVVLVNLSKEKKGTPEKAGTEKASLAKAEVVQIPE